MTTKRVSSGLRLRLEERRRERAKTRPGQPTTREIAEAIERLRNLLAHHYGINNYSFIVNGAGAVLASSQTIGVIEAVIKE